MLLRMNLLLNLKKLSKFYDSGFFPVFSRFLQRFKKSNIEKKKNNHTDLSSWPERLESRPASISIPFDFFDKASIGSLVFDFPKWPNRNSRYTEI